MKRFLHFNEKGEFTHDDIGVDSECHWCWDNVQQYFVKGEKGYYVFATKVEPVEYWVSKFSTIPNKTHGGRIYK